MRHQEHIVCVKSDKVKNREYGFVEYELNVADLMLGQRAVLESDEDFRQVLPISIFTCNGKVWAYKRTPKGGETRLHNKVATCVGGHWDMADITLVNGVIDLEVSLKKAVDRELEEEVNVTANIIRTYKLPKMICCDDSEVDRVHMAMVWVHELDSEGVSSAEDQLETVGFMSPEELLNGKLDLENWARLTCEILLSTK